MGDIKCPFCGQELNQDNPQIIECRNNDCKKSYFMYGSKELWQELIRTRKALETMQVFVTKLYLSGKITDEQLERYKKMLISALGQK